MPVFDNIIFEIVIIFAGASILATVFLYLKQPVILAYIFLGMLAGPWGLKVIDNPDHLEHISHLGIILLMFLLGLSLHPQELYALFKKTSVIALSTCTLFSLTTFGIIWLWGFPFFDSLIVGLALMFSSTVVGIKLIPTSALHHKHIGELMISVLLFQDILAILVILYLQGSVQNNIYLEGFLLILKTVGFSICAFLIVKYVILKLFLRFGTIQDYLFLMTLGWCFLGAEVAHLLGLSYEIGAFINGVALAASPVSAVIADGLKPVREFFLILFFFSIGAKFDFFVTKQVIVPSIVLAFTILVLKPTLFSFAFKLSKETPEISREIGLRLGQASEFSLLVAYAAVAVGQIELRTSYLIQLTTILTFIFSTYVVVFKYPTPIALSEKNRQD